MDRILFERTALTSALSTYLSGKGWTNIEYREGFQFDIPINVPLVSVHFLPSGPDILQLGDSTEKLFTRIIQIDCYMESENKAISIADSISDFIDETSIYIKDKLNGDAIIGTFLSDTNSIYSTIAPPNLTSPKVNRWRAIIRATYESHYY